MIDLKNGKYNQLLVEFEFVVDLDLAIFKYIRAKANNPAYVDQKLMNTMDEKEVIKKFLERENVNPLTVIMPGFNTDAMYDDLLKNHLEELLHYATASDMFGLMITFLKESSSTGVTILCENKLQEEFIHSLNPKMVTIIEKNRKAVMLNNYNILYLKYYANALLYQMDDLAGKHIYIANARYNLEEKMNVPLLPVSVLVSDVNIIHLIDLYVGVKYYRDKSIYDKKLDL